MKILAVIPARGGSKGIPRKNVRLMNNKPLIYYAINNALKSPSITDIAVSSDDEEIIEISKMYGAEVIVRDPVLAGDTVTLDPVVCDAVKKMEQAKNLRYDVVVTLQPTSPLLKVSTLNAAIEDFIEKGCDTYISVTNDPHLAWGKNEDGVYPLYEKRVNRQLLPPSFVETGAFVITKREFVTENSRFGKKISVYEIPAEESVDIDSTGDWIVCESQLRKKRIVFRADGHRLLGMGHIYRCLTLAFVMTGHDIILVTNGNHIEGLEKIRTSFLPYKTIENDDEFFDFLKIYKPDVIVNDCLDTTAEYIRKLKGLSGRVVTIEDLGTGIDTADAVINSLYENVNHRDNVYSGEKYICLRDEFILEQPIKINDVASNTLVLFGGTDPSNLTKRIYDMAKEAIETNKELSFTFITGLSYDYKGHGIVPKERITVVSDAKHVASYMRQADVAFTSQGRTVFELACMGVPSIVLAQNEREQLHTFAQMENGFINLGLGRDVSDDTIIKTFEWLVSTPGIRHEMHRLMLRHDLKSGIERVKRIILGE